MSEVFTSSAEHWPFMGWLVLCSSVVGVLPFGRRRSWWTFALGGLASVAYLATRFDGSAFLFLMGPFLLGGMIDLILHPTFSGKPLKSKVTLLVTYVAVLGFLLWMGCTEWVRTIVISRDKVTMRTSGGFRLAVNQVSIARPELRSLLVHSVSTHTEQWRFRSGETPPKEIFLDPDDRFKDRSGRVWTGDQLSRHIVAWAERAFEEKTVPSLYP